MMRLLLATVLMVMMPTALRPVEWTPSVRHALGAHV